MFMRNLEEISEGICVDAPYYKLYCVSRPCTTSIKLTKGAHIGKIAGFYIITQLITRQVKY